MRVRSISLGFVCLAVLAQDVTIKTNVPLVQIPVTVTDRKGRFIEKLSPEDFVVRDEGVPQKFQLDTSDTLVSPVAAVFVVQASGISAAALAKIQLVGPLVRPMIGDGGRAAVIAFDSEVEIRQPFTSDATKFRQVFEAIQPRVIKKARLYDAILEAAAILETRPLGDRRVIFLISESRDRSSHAKLGETIERVQKAGIAVYPITYSEQKIAWTARPEDDPVMPGGPDYGGAVVELGRLGAPNAAEALAHATGGRHQGFATFNGLQEVLARDANEIHSQYLLSFTPPDSSERMFRRLEVFLPKRPDAVVRARPGYWPY
jgi:VWFA-related protein